jgi:HD-like signal output (HDOD) protein
MKQILFVDDDTKILDGLRRSLRNQRGEWEMVFAEGGVAALTECASRRFDVIVSDARMPGLEGAEFLGHVRNLYPDTVRIILSGQCSRTAVLQCVGVTHQFLTKPCGPETLRAVIEHICRIRDLFQDVPGREAISGVQSLPIQTHIYQRLADQIESPTTSIERVAEIVSRDVGMSAKVVQLVSSGFFGTPPRISSVSHAARLLGLESFKAVFKSSSVFHPGSEAGSEEVLHQLSAHSIAVATLAREIAGTLTDDRKLISDAHLAGLLHEIGKLAMMGRSSVCSAEGTAIAPGGESGFDATGLDLGGYLAAIWGLPAPLVQAIAYHRAPRHCRAQPTVPLTAVHVANAILERSEDTGGDGAGFLDMTYLQTIGSAAHIDIWREKCRDCHPLGMLP